MAVDFITDDPDGLLQAFEDAIDLDDGDAGAINSWIPVKGGAYAHKGQHSKKAKMTPKAGNGYLRFSYTPLLNMEHDEAEQVRGYYHGHILQTFVAHFDGEIKSAKYVKRAVSDSPEEAVIAKPVIITKPKK